MILRKIFSEIKKHYLALLIAVTTLFAKIPGLTWGFPGTMHNDESNLIRSAMGMRFGDLNPHHFDWPSFSFYFHYFIFWTFIKLRTRLQILFGVDTMRELFSFWWGPELPFYLLGRISSISLLALTVMVVYFVARKITKNKFVSILSALIFSIGYRTTYYSFYTFPESLMLFLFMLSFYFSLKVVERPDKFSNYFLAAFFAGLGTSTKYHGYLLCIVLLCAHILGNKKNIRTLKDFFLLLFKKEIILAAFISVTAFFIGTPYALLDWETFTNRADYTGALWQIDHMGHGLNWGYHLFKVIPSNFGLPMALLGFYGLFLSLRSKNNLTKLNAFSFLILVAYIGTWGITRPHYSLPLFPFFSIMIALAIESLITRLNMDKRKTALIIVLLFSIPVYNSSREIVRRSRTDTRVLAGKWIENNIGKEEVIEGNLTATGIYGGNSPLFRYSDYKTAFPQFKLYEERDTFDKKYFIYLPDLQKLPDKYKDSEVVFEVDNDLRTGPSLVVRYYRENLGE